MKVFQVDVSFSMYVVAEDEAAALEVAEEHAQEELSNDLPCLDAREVVRAETVWPPSDLDSHPWCELGTTLTVRQWLTKEKRP